MDEAFFSEARERFLEIDDFDGDEKKKFFCAGRHYYLAFSEDVAYAAWEFAKRRSIRYPAPEEDVAGCRVLEMTLCDAPTCRQLCDEFDNFLSAEGTEDGL